MLLVALFAAMTAGTLAFASSTTVVINEVELNLAGGKAGAEQLELYNPSSSPVDVSGWAVSATADTTSTVTIPQGTTIPANRHLLVGSSSQWRDNSGEGIVLSDDWL